MCTCDSVLLALMGAHRVIHLLLAVGEQRAAFGAERPRLSAGRHHQVTVCVHFQYLPNFAKSLRIKENYRLIKFLFISTLRGNT